MLVEKRALMRDIKLIVLRSISQKIEQFRLTVNVIPPVEGWIKAIRVGLNMSRSQFAKKLGVSTEAARQLEKREAEGRATLNALRDAANAMEMKLVYAIVPREDSLEQYREKRARKLARSIVLRTHQHMRLEAQEVADEILEAAINDATLELLRTNDGRIWDSK